MADAQKTVGRDATRPQKAMQLSSSDEGVVVAVGSDGIGASERQSPVPTKPFGGVSSSKDEIAGGQAHKTISTHLIHMTDPATHDSLHIPFPDPV